MTRGQRFATIAVGLLVAAIFITAHCLMPVNRSWQFNRVLHYIWLGVIGLACAGAVAWFLWPRAKLARRDQERKRAHDRIIAVLITVVGAFAIIAFAEVRRDRVTQTYLASAVGDMAVVKGALDAWEADHKGALPGDLSDLAPKYLPAASLYYEFRNGPTASPKPQEVDPKGEEPSYILMPRIVGSAASRNESVENPILVYQRPGEGWAPLVAALGSKGGTGLIGEDDALRSAGAKKPTRR